MADWRLNCACQQQPRASAAPDPSTINDHVFLLQLSSLIPQGKFKFVFTELAERSQVCRVLAEASPKVDLVMHFAAIAYVGELT